MREEDIGKAVEVVAAVEIDHPKPVSKADLLNIITQAYAGEPPRSDTFPAMETATAGSGLKWVGRAIRRLEVRRW